MGWLTARIGWGETDRRILALALPALGALVAEPLYILADTAVVGNLGTPQLAGLALASSLLLIAFAVFIFLAYGTTNDGEDSATTWSSRSTRMVARL